MARRTNSELLQQISHVIQENPGRRAGWFARLLGLDNKSMSRALAQLEEQGQLLMEDDAGHLSWFGRRDSPSDGRL